MFKPTRVGVLWLVCALAAFAAPGPLTAQEEVLAAQVDRLLLEVAVGESGRAIYRLWAEVRNQGAQQLVLQLPPGFELTTVRLDGFEVAVGVAPGGGLAVPLSRWTMQAVHLDGVLPLALPPRRKGELALPLPVLSAPVARVEVRALVPGGRTWKLADPSRSGPVQGPPGSSEELMKWSGAGSANTLAKQMESNMLNRPAGPSAGTFVVAPGYQEITAAWSALSADPGPLVLRAGTAREAMPWQ
jgi:hypothetical protein